jgi:hypothetical protein
VIAMAGVERRRIMDSTVLPDCAGRNATRLILR